MWRHWANSSHSDRIGTGRGHFSRTGKEGSRAGIPRCHCPHYTAGSRTPNTGCSSPSCRIHTTRRTATNKARTSHWPGPPGRARGRSGSTTGGTRRSSRRACRRNMAGIPPCRCRRSHLGSTPHGRLHSRWCCKPGSGDRSASTSRRSWWLRGSHIPPSR